jgi:general nucleoside transport system ATP-binding protein
VSLAIELKGIEKTYPGVVANHDVDITIEKGKIHAIIGENGAGKSTLMKILYGMVKPDSGTISIFENPATIKSPQDAIGLGIGMVHQHFMLADNATVLENIVLGSEPMKAKVVVDYAKAREDLESIIKTYGLEINPEDLVADLGVGFRQRVEIAKVLFRGAKILILDEPTAVLVPQEVDELFKNLKVLTANGLTIIFISHKLDEVMSIADSISVMRRGTTVAELVPSKTNKKELAEYMIGGELPAPRPATTKPRDEKVLVVKDASLNDRTGRESLHSINLEIHAGEILGLAGVEGNGQDELIEMIMGLEKPTSGSVHTVGLDTTMSSLREIRDHGVGYIPQDRQRDGLLMAAPLWENRILGHQETKPMSNGLWIDKGAAKKDSERIIEEFDVRTPSNNVMASALSGGNQQKFIVGREMSGNPKMLIAAQPTRGVDVGAQAIIWDHLIEARLNGTGVLLVSADLDELFKLSDRIAVIFRGTIVDYLDPRSTTPEQLGLAMTGEKIA